MTNPNSSNLTPEGQRLADALVKAGIAYWSDDDEPGMPSDLRLYGQADDAELNAAALLLNAPEREGAGLWEALEAMRREAHECRDEAEMQVPGDYALANHYNAKAEGFEEAADILAAALTKQPALVGEDETGVREALDEINVHEEADNYELRADGDYTPNDFEKSMLEDFGAGLMAKVYEALAPQPPKAETPAGVGVDRALVQKIEDLCSSVNGDAYLGKEWEEQAVHDIRASLRALSTAPAARPGDEVETFETIRQWCEDTFGPITPERTVERAGEEFDELRAEPNNVTEAADVVIVLSRYPGLWAEINRKMGINRARKWRLMGDGTGYHVKDVPAAAPAADGGRA